MSAGRDQAETTRMLQAASAEYDDLPSDVADRLDRVLDQLPAADTLHAGSEARTDGWVERLRPRRVRYALLSAAAAVLVTVGGVAAAVQYVSGPSVGDSAAESVLSDDGGAADGGSDDRDQGEEGAAPNAEDFGTEEEPEADEPGLAEETASVETFATGSNYDSTTDLLAALRGLGGSSDEGGVPEELVELAAGGRLWQNCQDALAETYESLVVAADFARYESEPAVMVLLVSESGEHAVAVTPDCADGVIRELAFQK